MAEAFETVQPRIVDLYTLHKDIARAGRDARWHELRRWVDNDRTADIVDRYWELKQQADRHRHTIIVNFSPWLISGRAELTSALLSDLGRALGARLGEHIRRAFGDVLKRLMEFAPIVGAGLDIAAHGIGAGTLFRAGGDWSQKIAAKMTLGPSLDELKKELANLLSRLNGQQILVVLDDLDRLTPFEALEMVSVVKSLADLPNVIYLLSYEEVRLSELIGEATKTDGRSFLEKIVQYPVHIPALDVDDLSRLLDSDLEALLPALSEEDNIRLQYAWREALTSYVSTPRDVRRLVNSFAVAAAALSDFTDPVDLLILDTLRLFETNLYQYIRRNISDLTEEAVSLRQDDQGAAGIIEGVLKDVAETNAARCALALLFPRAEQLLKTAVYSGPRDNDGLRKARRISVADFAPAYFGLDPQKATWGRSELDRILNLDDPDAAFQTVEERVGSAAERDRPRLRRLFLDELRTTFEVSREITTDWLRGLLNASPVYIAAEDQTTRFFHVEDNSDRLRRLVIRALERLSQENRSALIASVIPRVTDLTILCTVYRSITPDRRPEGAVRDRIAVSLGDQADLLREQLLARVKSLACTGEIWRQATPRDIILFWWGGTLDDEVRQFTSTAMRTAEASLSLLSVPIHVVYSTDGNYETVAPIWSTILDLDALAASARKILIESSPEKHKQIAERFLTAMQNRERDREIRT
jgi:hypothetical protein